MDIGGEDKMKKIRIEKQIVFIFQELILQQNNLPNNGYQNNEP